MNAAVKPEAAEAVVFGKSDERELRDRMKKEFPADTFKAQTRRVIWFLPLQAMIWGGLVVILMAGLSWYANLGLGLLVGHTIGCQALLAHEVLHGAFGHEPAQLSGSGSSALPLQPSHRAPLPPEDVS